MIEPAHPDEMRIAWIGTPTPGGGVGGFCRQLLRGLARSGVSITAFVQGEEADAVFALGDAAERITIIAEPVNWQWNKWYSRHPLATFLSSFWARKNAHRRLVRRLFKSNQEVPFNVIVQFSQIELFALEKHLPSLPPILLFPCVHAAGELKWHNRESSYALKSESWWRHYVVRANLWYRARIQKRCCRSVYGVIGMSNRFNRLLSADYGVASTKQAVVYQPVEDEGLDEIGLQANADHPSKVKLLFVGRISVRKGIEMLIELSHRLDDIRDQLEIRIIGGGSFWSDYTAHLKEMNPNVGMYIGSLSNSEVKKQMARSHGLLVPSHYEPGGIVVAEALSHGCAVIVSDEVGSAERLTGISCRHFCSGNVEAFEVAVRQFVRDVQVDHQLIRESAKRAAKTSFSSELTFSALKHILALASSRLQISGRNE